MKKIILFSALLFTVCTFTSAQTPAQNKAKLLKAYEAFNTTHDMTPWLAIMTDDYADYAMGPEPVVGKQAVLEMSKTFLAAFPDNKVTIEKAIAEGNTIMLLVTVTGTWKNDFFGQKATGKSFQYKDVDIVEFDANGKMKAHWGVQDPSVFAAQIGMKLQ
jgi:predicted ester cyclase